VEQQISGLLLLKSTVGLEYQTETIDDFCDKKLHLMLMPLLIQVIPQ
jgi:hypothetical protein